MVWDIEFAPLLPLWLIAAIGAAAAAPVAFGLVRGLRGAWLRLSVLGLLLLALANPSILKEERDPLSDVVAVVVDRSASQAFAGRSDLTQRVREEVVSALESRPNVEIRIVETDPAADETLLFQALETALADVPPERMAGVLMITDGQVHDVPGDVAAIAEDAPVHALLTGRPDEVDRLIELAQAPRFGIVGESQDVRFRVVDERGGDELPAGDKTARVTFSVDGGEVAVRDVVPGAETTIDFQVAHGGANVVEIEVEPRAGEKSLINNHVLFTTQGIRDRLRVLLISGEPHAGERTWRNLLKADSAVDLVHFTILRPPEKQDGTPIDELSLIAFPTRELFSVKLHEFDLIVFDRYQRRGVLPLIYLDNVVEYVRRGGAVLAAAGPAFATQKSIYRSPLAAILPAVPTGEVVEAPYRAAITELGRRHPVTRGLPGGEGEAPRWGRWFRLIDAEIDRGEVVMSGPDDKPLMVLEREGEGRVALLLSDHAWLWARGYEGGGPQAELLRRLAHWLMKEPELEEESLTAELTGDRLVVTRSTVEDTVEPVVITAPDGSETTVTLSEQAPGIWRTSITAPVPGFYRLNSGGLSAVAAIGALRAKELTDVTASPRLLEPVVEASGGGIYWTGTEAGDGAEVPDIRLVREGRIARGSDWLGLRMRGAYVVTGTSTFPLMTGILACALILAAMGFTWYREGR